MKLPDCLESRIESCEVLVERLTALSATFSEELNALRRELSALKEAAEQTVPTEPVEQLQQPDELPQQPDDSEPQSEVLAGPVEPENRQVTIGERIGQQMAQESLNGRFEARKHADLTKALSLNDRFRFQRELFHGSSAEMTAVISALGACESLDEAWQCLKETTGKGEDDPAVKDFLHLLELHFA